MVIQLKSELFFYLSLYDLVLRIPPIAPVTLPCL